ncbi:hypothetical protein DB346_16310 [Verrucomicrobia bacterium LW23]|nr:hypothetical protein DB346_16310 [Verrucomicrobia bacterium LW23]
MNAPSLTSLAVTIPMGAARWRTSARVRRRAFTLVELMVAIAVLLVLMVAVVQLTKQLDQVWRASVTKVEMFGNARGAFFSITQRLRQASLNTYWDYDNPNAPTRYVRQSSLHFVCGPAKNLLSNSPQYSGSAVFFTAPLGYSEDKTDLGRLSNLINGCGYFVEYSQEPVMPSFLGNSYQRKWRWRLRQFTEPAEASLVQAPGWTDSTRCDWFRTYFASSAASAPVTHDVADNVILLLLVPVLPKGEDDGTALAPDYAYDSRQSRAFTTRPPAGSGYSGTTLHQLPPLVRVVMVVIDEKSSVRLNPPNSPTPVSLIPPTLFATSAALDGDLLALDKVLREHPMKISYRIFDSTIALRGAKWSRD